jgi:hypothetical protein
VSDVDVEDRPLTNERVSPPEANVPADYFGFSSTKVYMLPDKVSWVELKVLNEGERRQYLNETNREVKFARGSQDAAIRLRPGDDKASLLKMAIVGWNLVRNGAPMPFNTATLQQFLTLTDPKLVDLIEKEVRLMNPWLLAEMTLEDFDREISQLQELRQKKLEEEQGN